MIYIIIVLSFLLEVAFSNIISISLLTPLFLITSFSILYPYFKNNKTNFFIVCTFSGLIYDIALTDSLFINTISFGIISVLIILGYRYAKYNMFNANLINIITIVFYRIITYLLLFVVDFINFNYKSLLEGIYNSILINVIYGIVIYTIVNLLSKLFNIKRVE